MKKKFIVIVIVIVFVAGWYLGQSGFALTRTDSGGVVLEQNRDRAPKNVDWQLLWEAIDRINEKYVDRPADPQKLLYGAVSGAVSSLDDPYSVFLEPKDAEDFQAELKGSFDGIGAEIAMKNEQLVVVAPLDGSPAQKAGVRAGDIILKVDDQETADFTLEEAVNRIRGPAGTTVTLSVLHPKATRALEIKITRAKIEVKSADYSIREYKGKKLGYLRLRRFGEDTQGIVESAIAAFLTANVSGVILDVRNNPGGYLESAVEVAGNWVEKGRTVVIQHYGDGTEQRYDSSGGSRLRRIKTVVLQNGGSASASEIVAGALKDYNLATLVGEKSFGKGSVQELVSLRGGADIKITVAKWLTPDGHDLNREGIEPDVKIGLSDEDFNANRDPQLDRALEILVP
ncbi:MAG: S41 family peptidase [Candidatus Doudnabacteria bacterium]|nr:S41 family peptidase [Candidatus Doudnabacteria bacterium]